MPHYESNSRLRQAVEKPLGFFFFFCLIVVLLYCDNCFCFSQNVMDIFGGWVTTKQYQLHSSCDFVRHCSFVKWVKYLYVKTQKSKAKKKEPGCSLGWLQRKEGGQCSQHTLARQLQNPEVIHPQYMYYHRWQVNLLWTAKQTVHLCRWIVWRVIGQQCVAI